MIKVEKGFFPEIEAAFIEWINKHNIKLILFDFDDTLIDTSKIFLDQIDLFINFGGEKISNLDLNAFRLRYKELEDKNFKERGVSITTWIHIVNELASEHGEVLLEGIEIFNEIYRILPDIYDGVKETLELCRKTGVKMGLVTHAGLEWTRFKMEGHDLGKYFDHVKAIDPEKIKYKSANEWREEVEFFGVDAMNVLVVGDSIHGDIEAAQEAGVGHVAWIPSKVRWHKDDKTPTGVYVINGVRNLIPTLVTKK